MEDKNINNMFRLGFTGLACGYAGLKVGLIDDLIVGYTLIFSGSISVLMSLKSTGMLGKFLFNGTYKYKPVRTKDLLIGTTGFSNVTINFDMQNSTLLIAGQRGSGKSTLLKSILVNSIKNYDSNEMTYALIDLKGGVELYPFSKFDQVKYFARTMEESREVLNSIKIEMHDRYRKFYNENVSNLEEYNNVSNFKLSKLVLVIDEYSLVHQDKKATKDMEEIMSLSRGAGIPVILTTQRPDAKIINGRIKANIDYVIGLKVLDRINSEVIGIEGLENLNGKGHGILKSNKLVEFKSFYISNQDIKKYL